MNVFSNVLTKRLKHGFVDKRAIKKRPGKAVLALVVNYRKTVQRNKLFHSKQQ